MVYLASSGADPIWTVIERASWIAVLLGSIGLIVVISQLARLVKRPKLRLGFPYDPGGLKPHLQRAREQQELNVNWPPGSQLSDPVRIAVIAVNEGGATALDLDFEVRYPGWLVPEGDHELQQPPGLNQWSFFRHGLALNPSTTHFLRATFRVPVDRNSIPIHVIASMRDTRPTDKLLRIRISRDAN